MKTVDFSYFIERYNAGEMSETEKQWFLKELDGNEQLQKEVLLRKKTEEILKNQNVISLKNKLIEIERKRELNTPVRNTGRTGYMKYAAIVTGLVLIGSFALYSGKNLTNDEAVSRYYQVYQPSTSQRSLKIETNADFKQALDFFNTHDYKKAAILFTKVVENNPKDMQSTFLNGMSNFENRKYPEAKQSFGTVIDNNNNLFIDEAEWYLAFCYLRTDERDKAIQKFEAIKKENGNHQSDARKILRKLK
jgi:tetratricopeptide (TPR) repeat protein